MNDRKSFLGKISSWGESNHHYMAVPHDIGTYFLDQGQKRVLVQFDESPPFHCALQRHKVVGFQFMVSKRLLKETKTEPGQEVQVQIWADHSPYQATMPEALGAVLETDPEAHQAFHQLTPGRQRSIIYWIARIKSTDRQIEKALFAAEQLKAGLNDPRKW